MTPRGQIHVEKLPAELLAAIFRLLDPDGFIAFGLCYQTLWGHAIQSYKNEYCRWKKTYSLAGTPIMYVGSHLKVLPQFVYDEYPDLIPEETPREIRKRGRIITRTTAAFNKAVLEFDQTPLPYDDAYRVSFTKHIANAKIPANRHESMKASFPTFSIEKGSKWLLGNLTNNEFIRMEAVGTTDVAHTRHGWLTLDTLLYWLICWRGDGDQQNLDWEYLDDSSAPPTGLETERGAVPYTNQHTVPSGLSGPKTGLVIVWKWLQTEIWKRDGLIALPHCTG